MATYYIIDPNARHHMVWSHLWKKFLTDYDAGYRVREFGYTNFKYAEKRALELMARFNLESIQVVDRATLFTRLDVKDWSHGA